MICKICGFDSSKPLGKALNSAKKGQTVYLLMNKNGKKYIAHRSHTQELKGGDHKWHH